MNRIFFFLLSCTFLFSGCTDDGAGAGMHVAVVDGLGRPLANAVVVLGDRDGSLSAYATTGAGGDVFFAAPPPEATVTAAIRCTPPDSTRTYYFADTTYAVTVARVLLTLGSCDSNRDQVTVTVAAPVGVAASDITLGPITYAGPTASLDVADALQDDGRISVVALGYDDGGGIVGYGLAVDQPAVAGGMIAVAIDRNDIARNRHVFDNVPSRAVSYFAYAALIRKHASTNLPVNFAMGSLPLPAALTTYAIPGFGDTYNFGASISLDRDNDGNPDADVGLVRYLATAADQVFDFASVPVVPTALTWAAGSDGRPVISWSGGDPLATAQTVAFNYSTTSPKNSFHHSMTVRASAASIVYPALPDVLAAFRPAAYSDLSLETIKMDAPVAYRDYLTAIAENAARSYEAAGLNRYAYSRISRVP